MSFPRVSRARRTRSRARSESGNRPARQARGPPPRVLLAPLRRCPRASRATRASRFRRSSRPRDERRSRREASHEKTDGILRQDLNEPRLLCPLSQRRNRVDPAEGAEGTTTSADCANRCDSVPPPPVEPRSVLKPREENVASFTDASPQRRPLSPFSFVAKDPPCRPRRGRRGDHDVGRLR